MERQMYMTIVIFAAATFQHGNAVSNSSTAAFAQFLRNLSSQGYEPRLRPTEKATNVSMQIFVIKLGPVNLKHMSLQSEIIVRFWWHDQRLNFDNKTELNLAADLSDSIWVPDVYVLNAVKTESHKAFKDNFRLVIGPGGSVYASFRLTIEFSCDFDFKSFPLDTQFCPIKFESYAYNKNQLNLSWVDQLKPVVFPRKIETAGYMVYLEKVNVDEFSYQHVPFITLIAFFRIKRVYQYYIYHVYIPSGVIVALSWGTFWFPPSAFPARVTLIVTNLLTSILIFSSIGNSMPKVAYNTALEVFALANISFIFAVMIEYMLVLRLQNQPKKISKSDIDGENNPTDYQNEVFKDTEEKARDISSPPNSFVKNPKKENERVESKNEHIVDRCAAVVFPFFYFVFLTSYALYYMI